MNVFDLDHVASRQGVALKHSGAFGRTWPISKVLVEVKWYEEVKNVINTCSIDQLYSREKLFQTLQMLFSLLQM